MEGLSVIRQGFGGAPQERGRRRAEKLDSPKTPFWTPVSPHDAREFK